MSEKPIHPKDREFSMRVREAADKVFKAKFGEEFKRENELHERAKSFVEQTFQLTMQVVHTAAEKGHPYNPNDASKLVEKLLIDNFNSWNKDELLFLVALVHTGLIMERVDEQAQMGLIGKNKDFPL